MEEPLVEEAAEQARSKKSKKKTQAGRAAAAGDEPSEATPPVAPAPPPAPAPKPVASAAERAEAALRAAIAGDGLSALEAALAAATCHRFKPLAAARFDATAMRVADGYAPGVASDVLVRDSAELPARLHGLGLRSRVKLAPAAFVGSLARSLPLFIDRAQNTLPDAAILTSTRGYMPQLEAFFGAGAFDEGNEQLRFDHFAHRSGTRLAREMRDAWAAMQAERPGATDGALAAPAAAIGIDVASGRVHSKFQRVRTAEREAAWAVEEEASGRCADCGRGHDDRLILLCDSCNTGTSAGLKWIILTLAPPGCRIVPDAVAAPSAPTQTAVKFFAAGFVTSRPAVMRAATCAVEVFWPSSYSSTEAASVSTLTPPPCM
jgi:hypothetical protein